MYLGLGIYTYYRGIIKWNHRQQSVTDLKNQKGLATQTDWSTDVFLPVYPFWLIFLSSSLAQLYFVNLVQYLVCPECL